jgi:16S rRNA (guanine527-N7)-methyltransferase
MAAAPPGTYAAPTPDLWQALGWTPSGQQQAQLQLLQQQLRQWNTRVNLTRLVEGEDYWIAQVLDSLWPLLPPIRQGAAAATGEPLRIIDVGTGGGFPGLAVAIALPGARVTLVDSVGRKLEAVRAMAAALGLAERLELRCERIELSGRQGECRGMFDLALARAVARAPVVAEYLVPLLKAGGTALLYRGQWGDGDTAELERAVVPLRARISGIRCRELPAGRGQRHVVELQPCGPCPRTYPRPVGVPSKQPLGADGTSGQAEPGPG